MPTGNTATLQSLRGKIQTFRRGCPPGLIDSFINDRISSIVNGRTYWTDLVTRGVLNIPNSYSNGLVNTTSGSTLIQGTGPDSNGNYTAWPVSDAVNTTIPNGIQYPGVQDVTPGSMAGITPYGWLNVDPGGAFPEVVPILSTTATTFRVNLQYPHSMGCLLWASSLAGLQIRIGGNNPIYTITSVQTLSATGGTLTIDIPWGGPGLQAANYFTVKQYYAFTPAFSKLIKVLDTQQGVPLFINKSLVDLDWIDPQRTSTGPPTDMVPYGKDANGNVVWELWPSQTSAYPLYYQVYQQWPTLVAETDQPPPFIDPNIWVWGALADALRYKASSDDPYHNPKLADHYEERYRMGVVSAYNADSAKMDHELQRDAHLYNLPGYGSVFYQSHDYDWGPWINL